MDAFNDGRALQRLLDELGRLPGIGPATAAGVVAFAYDKPAVYLETNVRSVFLHELFPDQEGVPAYIVFSDAALRDMVRRKPQDIQAFLSVSGVGKVKAEKYSDAFLKAITGYERKNSPNGLP